MNFLAPMAFLLALLMPMIIAMYLLKLRRAKRPVSSIYLWQRMVRDIEANAPWQRLQRNILLILQLLILAALILALARPVIWREGLGGSAAIIIMDTSASMSAIDIRPNRLEGAKDLAHQMIDDLPEDTPVTIINAGSKTQTILSSSLDRRQAHQKIANIQTGTAGADLSSALQLASTIAINQPETEIIIFSDGGAPPTNHQEIHGHVRYFPLGVRGENQSVSLLSFDPSPGGESGTVFTQVTNYGATTANRRLGLYADGQLFSAHDLEIPPGEEKTVLVEGLPANIMHIEARLLRDEYTVDDLQMDDSVLAVNRQNQNAQVTLVSEGNIFLETALSLMPGVETTQLEITQTVDLPPADLTIFDSILPVTPALPSSNLLFISPPSSSQFITITGVISRPIPIPADPTHPLLNNIFLEEVNILDAVHLIQPDWAEPVIITDDSINRQIPSSPLLYVGETEGRRIAVLAFDLRRSDLPLQVAFPILMANLVDWLTPGRKSDIPIHIAPGDALTFSPHAPDISSSLITRPDSSTVQIAVQEGKITFADTFQLGLYQVDLGDGELIQFAVNLISPQESRTQPVKGMAISGIEPTQATGVPQYTRRELWRIFAGIALILLIVEWLVYQRFAFTRLSKTIKRRIRGSLLYNRFM